MRQAVGRRGFTHQRADDFEFAGSRDLTPLEQCGFRCGQRGAARFHPAEGRVAVQRKSRSDRIDRDRGRELLRGTDEKALYEAAVTVMMRQVFLLSAEERGLLLLGDPLYDQHYAVSTLRDQLQEVSDHQGPEVLGLGLGPPGELVEGGATAVEGEQIVHAADPSAERFFV